MNVLVSGRAPPRQLNIETLVTAATAEYKLLARRVRTNAINRTGYRDGCSISMRKLISQSLIRQASRDLSLYKVGTGRVLAVVSGAIHSYGLGVTQNLNGMSYCKWSLAKVAKAKRSLIISKSKCVIALRTCFTLRKARLPEFSAVHWLCQLNN